MPVEHGLIDLQGLALSHGQARSLELPIALDPVALGGQEYDAAGSGTDVKLDVSRTTSGYALRLRLDTELAGPCMRCLDPARPQLHVEAREVDQPSVDDEELQSPYVTEGQLDLTRWANDAVVLALPAQLLCREDCAGLCPVCGESLNDADPEDHRHSSSGDPRMAKLRDLKLE